MERSYEIGGQTITLEIDENYVVVKFNDEIRKSSKAKALSDLNAGVFYRNELEIPGENLVLIPLSNLKSKVRPSDIKQKLSSEKTVNSVRQVYIVGNVKLVASDLISIGLEGYASASDDVFKEYKLQVIEEIFENEFLVHQGTNRDTIETVIALNEDKRVNYAEPDFINIGEHLAKAKPNFKTPLQTRLLQDCILDVQAGQREVAECLSEINGP